MAEDQGKKEDQFDFTSAGEALGYISLEQARLLAMQTARDNPGNYGRRFVGLQMVFQPVEQEEGEDYYFVTLSFRPEGDFRGTTGQEQFVIEKEGAIAYRQVLSLPRGGGQRHLPAIPIAIGLLVVIVAAVGVAFATGVLGREKKEEPPVAGSVPGNTPSSAPASP